MFQRLTYTNIYIQEYSKARRRRKSGNEIAALAKEFPHTRLDTRNYRLGKGSARYNSGESTSR